MPACCSRAASITMMPWPIEAAPVSKDSTRRPGYFSISSLAIICEVLKVPLMLLAKPIYSISRPACSSGSYASIKVGISTWVVVGISPPRTLS